MEEAIEQALLNEVPLVVVDTETTGLSPTLGHRVIEVAAIRFEGWREVARFSSLVDPQRPIDPGAARVHGIADADLQGAPHFEALLPALQEFFAGTLLVAHNAAFDAAFLGEEFSLAGRAGEPPNAWLCTLRLARHFFYFGRNSLGNVAYQLGIRTSRAHRALNDAHTTAEVLRRMARQLESRRMHTVGDFLHGQGGAIYAPQPADGPALPPLLATALSSGRRVYIQYAGPGGASGRVITPRQVHRRAGHVYLIAHCHLRGEQRTFRLDRILRIEPVG